MLLHEKLNLEEKHVWVYILNHFCKGESLSLSWALENGACLVMTPNSPAHLDLRVAWVSWTTDHEVLSSTLESLQVFTILPPSPKSYLLPWDGNTVLTQLWGAQQREAFAQENGLRSSNNGAAGGLAGTREGHRGWLSSYRRVCVVYVPRGGCWECS